MSGLLGALLALLQILPQSKRDLQKTAAQKLYPTAIELRNVEQEPPGPRLLRVRVWAARDFRDQTVNWQPRFRRVVERVNQRLRRWPGVHFEIVEFKTWDVGTQTGGIDTLLAELERADAGDDVDYVIGLASAVALWPNNLHQLGGARVMGKHFVMRSLHDLAEYQALQQYFNLIDDSDRERLLAERKAHKEEVCFLHEWAHTLGAIHARHPRFVMNPTYDSEQFTMDDGNSRIIVLGLNRRTSPEWGRELKTLVEKAQFDDWDYEDRKRLLAFLASWHAPTNLAAPKVDKPPPPAPVPAPAGPRPGKLDLTYRGQQPAPEPSPQAAAGGGTTKNDETYQRTVEAGREALVEGKFDMALLLSAQLKRDFPHRPGGAALAENVAAAKAAGRRDIRGAIKHLQRAIELDPDDRAAWGALAECARITRNQLELARIRAEYQKRFGKPLPEGR